MCNSLLPYVLRALSRMIDNMTTISMGIRCRVLGVGGTGGRSFVSSAHWQGETERRALILYTVDRDVSTLHLEQRACECQS